MRDKRHDDRSFGGFGKHDIMDKIGEKFSSLFPRRSRKNDKDDDLLTAFSSRGSDEYELFVDEEKERKRLRQQQKSKPRQPKKAKPKKPTTPLMRRIRNVLTSFVIVAVVLIICVVLSLTVLFKTQNYDVSGSTKYTDEEIINTCGITTNENIFLANKNAAERRLIKNYAYIEEANVSFSIPDTITIKITEAVESYIVKIADTSYLIASSQGRILEKCESPEGYDLPMFLCSDITGGDVGDYIEYEDETTHDIINAIVTVFKDNGYTNITEIDATDTANISFTYDNRIKVKIGLPEDISYKVRTAMTIIIEKLDLNGSNTTEGELDVSNCNVTKKSYFREQSLIDAQVETTAPIDRDDVDGDGFDDETGEEVEEQEEETKPPLSQDDWYLE